MGMYSGNVLYMLQYTVGGEGFYLDFGSLIGPYQGGHSRAISD